ncbi:MAG: hypothetical protein ACK4N5_14485, partial [Myxococcales bacterium]
LSVFHTAKAKWMVVLRRQIENMTAALPVLAVLFIPIVLGMGKLYVWVNPEAHPHLNHEELHLIHHKHGYLNAGGFVVRGLVYFGIWIVVAHLLRGWSLKQDSARDIGLTVRQRKLGVGGLPLLALSITFASFDWLMSLTPVWFSTIYGVYYFAGGFLGAICLLTLTTTYAQGKDLYGRLVSLHHFHNLGKLMLAFTAFWAYIAFSQLLLVWIANIPEEVPWYKVRLSGSWYPVSIALGLLHFVVPFFILLSRDIKLKPKALAVMAVYLLAVCYLDTYWLVIPAIQPDSPMPSWTDLTAFVGVGGVAVAFAVFRMRGTYSVPVGDPYLQDSLRYTQP